MTPSPRPVRPSRESVDQDILDTAAGLIARRGVKDTAVQAVADDTGYSKAGILNRFASKELLVEAAIAQCIRQTQDVEARVAQLAPGAARDAAALGALIELSLARPGWVELVLAALSEGRGDDVRERLTPVASALLGAFGIEGPAGDGTGASLERRARVVAAIGAVAVLALTYQPDATAAQAAPLMQTIAGNTLGR